jgi:hypothetical protein
VYAPPFCVRTAKFGRFSHAFTLVQVAGNKQGFKFKLLLKASFKPLFLCSDPSNFFFYLFFYSNCFKQKPRRDAATILARERKEKRRKAMVALCR